MNNKALPISNPKIIGFLHHAYPLAIVGNHNDYIPWFYSNFIQLVCNTDYFEGKNDHLIDFQFPNDPLHSYPCIESFAVKPEFLDKELDIVPFIINSINKKCYVYTHVDEYFIPNRKSFNNKHFVHNILVYGYGKNHLKVLGFDLNRKFTHSEVNFEDFDKGFINSDYKLTILFNYNNYITPKFSINTVIRSLKDYMQSINSINGNGFLPENPVFGLDVYSQLSQYLTIVTEEQRKIDIRPFHILWEHKKIMVERIKYLELIKHLNQTQGLLEKAKEVENLSVVIRNTALKYNFTKNKTTVSKLTDIMERLKYIESSLLTNLLSYLY